MSNINAANTNYGQPLPPKRDFVVLSVREIKILGMPPVPPTPPVRSAFNTTPPLNPPHRLFDSPTHHLVYQGWLLGRLQQGAHAQIAANANANPANVNASRRVG